MSLSMKTDQKSIQGVSTQQDEDSFGIRGRKTRVKREKLEKISRSRPTSWNLAEDRDSLAAFSLPGHHRYRALPTSVSAHTPEAVLRLDPYCWPTGRARERGQRLVWPTVAITAKKD